MSPTQGPKPDVRPTVRTAADVLQVLHRLPAVVVLEISELDENKTREGAA